MASKYLQKSRVVEATRFFVPLTYRVDCHLSIAGDNPLLVKSGDWIVHDPLGHIYSCSDQEFQELFDLVEEVEDGRTEKAAR